MCRTSNFVRSIQNKKDACQYQCEHLRQISWKTLLIHKRFEVTVIRHGLVSTVKGLHSVLHRNVASVSKRPNASPRSHLRPRIKWQMLRYRLAHGSAHQSWLGRSRAHHWYCTHWVIHDLHTNCTALPDSMHNCNKRLKNSDERSTDPALATPWRVKSCALAMMQRSLQLWAFAAYTVQCISMGKNNPPNCHHLWIWAHAEYTIPWAQQVHNPNGILTGSAVSEGLTVVSNRHTHRLYYICSNRLHLCTRCMQCGLTITQIMFVDVPHWIIPHHLPS